MGGEVVTFERLNLLGLPLDDVDLEQAAGVLRGWLVRPESAHTVVTLNPEIVVQAETDDGLRKAIRGANLVTADGVGIVWAVRRLLHRKLRGRVTGIDLAIQLMELGRGDLKVFFLGGRPTVAARAAEHCRQRFGIQIAGVQDGYFRPEQTDEVVELVRSSGANLLLTALGAGRQETFNETFRDALGVQVAIGVGGTLDVLAGEVKRAPGWTSRLGVEWLWRVVTLRRWKRARRLVEFALRCSVDPG